MFVRFNSNYLPRCSIAKFHASNLLMKRDYYEVLGLTPKASKSQIKKSYYELSLRFHPDRNKDDEKAATKFREITEAYEVLGDLGQRRIYDRRFGGARVEGSVSHKERDMHPKVQKPVKQKAPSVFRSDIYNFDEWAKNHYQETFQRKQREKRAYEELIIEKYDQNLRKKDKDRAIVATTVLGIVVGICWLIIFLEENSRDKPR